MRAFKRTFILIRYQWYIHFNPISFFFLSREGEEKKEKTQRWYRAKDNIVLPRSFEVAKKRGLIKRFLRYFFSRNSPKPRPSSPDVDCNLSPRRFIPRKTTWTKHRLMRLALEASSSSRGSKVESLDTTPTRPLDSTRLPFFSRPSSGDDPTPQRSPRGIELFDYLLFFFSPLDLSSYC